MIIRFHKGFYCDAVIPTANEGVGLQAAPFDVVWQLPADINPSKTVQELENVQATDPLTGALLFNADGTPQWETQTVTNPDGTTSEQIVTQTVNKTYALLENPNIFTPADIQAVALSYKVV
jgi:hypothetical protein